MNHVNKYHKQYWKHIQKMWKEINATFEKQSEDFRLLILDKRLAPYIYYCGNRETESNDESGLMKRLRGK